ncbi:MAG: hemolysin family protein [Gemmatimonadota bacterium]
MTMLLVVIAVGLAISFICSILEAVLLSMSQSYVVLLRDRGEKAGELLSRMRENIDEPIAAILTLNTIAHTVSASVGGAMALRVFGNEWVALFSAVLTLAILVFSEILPKTLGATYWKTLARPAAYTLRGMIVVMKPVLIPLSWLNQLISPRGGTGPTVSRSELEILAEIGRKEGTIDQAEWEVMTNVMGLSEVRVGEVMTPRTRIVAVAASAPLGEAMQIMLDEGRLRLPVYGTSLDDIVGLLLAREAWRAARKSETQPVSAVMRPAHFVPETKPVEELIREMRRERLKMAIVIDEFGGTSGLVTLEDLIEEIVGEIDDEHEARTAPFEDVAGEVRILGQVPIREVNERLGLVVVDEEHETIAGYLMGRLGRIPQAGDEVQVPGGRLSVSTMSGRRVERVIFRLESGSVTG